MVILVGRSWRLNSEANLEKAEMDHFICNIMLNITFGDGWNGHDHPLPLRLLEIQKELL